MKTYCSSCGFKMEYPASSGKPNFCSGCGTSLGNVKNTPVINEEVAGGDDNGLVDEPTYIPQIDELQFDLIQGDTMSSVSMGEIFKAASMADSRPQKDPTKNPRISKKKILDQLKKESSAIRPKGGESK